MITAFIIVGCIVAACLVIAAIAAVGMSGACATAAEDDEQASILAEQTSKRIIAFPNTAVSASQ